MIPLKHFWVQNVNAILILEDLAVKIIIMKHHIVFNEK